MSKSFRNDALVYYALQKLFAKLLAGSESDHISQATVQRHETCVDLPICRLSGSDLVNGDLITRSITLRSIAITVGKSS